ncbi:MAG: hypothetical protein P4L46_19250 [Fimbriimonas sp.]|nr:hypothetical protein [Fimbriimonas sp.]
METNERTIAWLMEGDPSIRWQVMRDLLDLPADRWQSVRTRSAEDGWVRRFLDLQDPVGTWGGGIYSPKWTSTTYTLLTLIDCGVDASNSVAKRGAEQILLRGIGRGNVDGKLGSLVSNDVCVWGFYLNIAAYFRLESPMLSELCALLIREQMGDGGWNCRRLREKSVHHSSFHTTFNVLDGLREAARAEWIDSKTFLESEGRAMEFMLQHRMYRSDRTGEIVNAHFTEFSYPPRWHYDVLRGLDYIRSTPFARDTRLADAIDLVRQRGPTGIWPAQNRHPGKFHFAMEAAPRQSRWNTLRALRVLKACG